MDAVVGERATGGAGRWRPTGAARRRCGRRTSASTGRPSLRSGVAVSPSSSTGRTWSSRARYDGAAAWWNSSTMTTSKCVGVEVLAGPRRRRLWIDAKTCSKRCGRSPPTHSSPKAWSRSACRKVARLCVEDLLAMRDEEQPRARQRRRAAARSRPPPSRSCRCRWPTTSRLRWWPRWRDSAICSSSRSWNGSGRSSIGLSDDATVPRSRVLRAAVELVAVVGDEVAAAPVALEDGGDLVDDVGVARARRRARSTRGQLTCAEWVRFDEPM